MRKMITILILSLIFSIPVFAPGVKVFYLLKEPSVNVYETLINAIVKIESNGNDSAYNTLENACGAFQIRECRIQHYNRLTGSDYALSDCFDYDISKRVFLYFAQGKTFEKASKDWNGSGPMTKIYWDKVQKALL